MKTWSLRTSSMKTVLGYGINKSGAMRFITTSLTTFSKINRWIVFALAVFVWMSLFAVPHAYVAGTIYYVSPTGSDSNDGLSLTKPFATIQKCANVVSAGDTCLIRAGVYRETVTVSTSGTANAPVVFKAYNEEQVTISGADVLTSAWTLHSGHVYRTNLAWDLNVRNADQITNNQIFVDGQMMPEARWPNISIAHLTQMQNSDKARADDADVPNSYTAAYIDDALNPFSSNFWQGAKINFGPGWSIIHTTCDVTGSTSNGVSFQCNPDPGSYYDQTYWDGPGTLYHPSGGNYYYLWGKLEALDAPGEWFRAADGTLYLWTSDGAAPTAHTVEAKRRLWAFDLSGQTHITLDGLHIFAATVKTDEQSHYLRLQNLDLQYLWHFQEILPLFSRTGIVGIEFRGDDNILRDSNLTYSAGEMISMSGKRNQAVNNVVQSAAYMGSSAAVFGSTWTQLNPGGADKNQLWQNTIFNTGRYPVQADPGLDVKYNDLYDSHLQIMDLGVVYGWGADGKNAEIAYNLVHDNWAEYNEDLNYYGGFGIYLDDDTYNYKVYRNIIWNTTSSGIFLSGTNGTIIGYPRSTPSNRNIFNNTVDRALSAMAKPLYNGWPQTLNGSRFVNNIAAASTLDDSDLVISNNYIGDGLYLDRAHHDYQLRHYSLAVNTGTDLGSPYMDSPMQPIGAPDLGAIERGRDPWIAGAVIREQDMNGLHIACTANANGETATCVISDLPIGRRIPQNFQIRVAASTPTQNCLNEMDYATHKGIATCVVSTTGLNGIQPILIQLGSSDWMTTTATVNLGALQITTIQPNYGFTDGSTQVTIQGRRFDTTPVGYAHTISLNNSSGTPLYNYQIPIQINTASLIAAHKMRSDCGDLRFRDAYDYLDYWLEKGCNTGSTRLWVEVTFIPTGSSTITLTYGNESLLPVSDGRQTFVFFDDFSDGVIDSTWWTLGADNGSFYAVTEANGKMVLAGKMDSAHLDEEGSFYLNNWQIDYPTSFAIDSDISVITGSMNFKASPGTFLNVEGIPGGDPLGKDIAYWNGGWNIVGKSGVSTSTFANHQFSIGFTGPSGSRTIRWFENGDRVNPLATHIDYNQSVWGNFSYGPDELGRFDVRFDNIRVRNFVYPEPSVSIGSEVSTGLRVTFDGALCRAVVPVDAARLTCKIPPHEVDVVDVTLVNPDAQSYTLVNGFTYIEGMRVYLPVVR